MSYMSLGSQETQPDGREQNQPLLDDYTEDDEFIEDAKRRVRRKRHRKRCKLALLLTGFVIVAGCIVIVPIIISWRRSHDKDNRVRPTSNSVLGRYQHAAVASDVTQCSQIGKSILLKKGSAVDAAIASLFCMGLTDPQSMGIGGGFLMTVYNRTDKSVSVIDARETAPAAANKSMFVGRPELASRGPLSVAVPGEVSGYYKAHQLYGRLPWSNVVAPSIDMAANGFAVPNSLAEALQQDKETILNSTYLSKAYVNPATGKLYKTGEIMKCPSLAATLQSISADPTGFYTGQLMKDVVADIREAGGIITEQDMKNYSVKVREPSVTTLRSGLRVVAPPPPGSGPVLEFILQILDGFLLTPDSLSGESTLLTYHRMIEAFKFAYAKRTYLGDEDFVDVAELVANLTSRKYADEIRKLIWDNTTHGTDYYGPVWDGNVKTGTAHLSVVAENGDAVSVTSTVNARFGSKVMGQRTGIVFNNEMDDFSTPNLTNTFGLRPSPANFIQPWKRPLSSMCPAIVLDQSGEVTMAVGAAGGSRITTTTAMVMSFVLWFGDNIKQAIDELRLHHQLLPATAFYEDGFPQSLVSGLEGLRHNMTWQSIGKSIVQGITRTGNGQLEANSDYRKGGSPDGY